MSTTAVRPTSAAELLAARPPRRLRGRVSRWLWALVVLGLIVFAWFNIHGSFSDLWSGLFGSQGISDILKRSVPPKTDVLHSSITDGIVTFSTAVLGTFLSVLASLVLVPLAARNLTPNRLLYEGARMILAVTRSIPDLIFALLFIVAVGFGPFSGMLALAAHGTGVMGKLYAEAVEEMDMSPVEALRVAGASRTQIFLHAVLPSIAPTFVGLTLYRFDVNFRSSLVLGVVGAGGIGFDINQSISLFQYRQVFTELVVVLVFVLVIERVSTILRNRIHDGRD